MKLLSLLIPVFFLATLSSCSKDGDPGPAGADGTPGANGTNGTNGNANVTVYNFGTRTFTYETAYSLKNLSQGKIDSSLILGYYNPATESPSSWYPAPGLGPGSAYMARSYIYTPLSTFVFSVRLTKAYESGQYNTAVTFTKFRVFVVPANTMISGRSSVPGAPAINYDDYNAVCRYYNIAP